VVSVSVMEAATHLGVSPDTIRRRIRNGELQARREPTPQGYIWRVELPEEESAEEAALKATNPAAWRELVDVLKDEVALLREQLAAHQEELVSKNKQIEQLHILLQQAQASLPEPKDRRSWWQRLWRRD
jgi:hypothetical protein